MAVGSRRLLVRVWLVMVPAVAGLLLGLLTVGSPATAAPADAGTTSTAAAAATMPDGSAVAPTGAADGESAPGTITVGQDHDQVTAAGHVDAVAYINAQDTGAVTQVSTGDVHACALTAEGFVYCWGSNERYPLGHGEGGSAGDGSLVPVPVVDGVEGFENGTVAQISTGRQHSCAVTVEKTLYCWGYNGSGRLGNGQKGEKSSSLVPVKVHDGNDGFVNGSVVELSLGWYHTCAVTDTGTGGTVYCWGYGHSGQLGSGESGGDITSKLPKKVVDGEGFENGQVTQVSGGRGHTCALTENKEAYCWGYNREGALGDNSTRTSPSPVKVAAKTDFLNDSVTQVSAGDNFTCALTDDGEAFCWGRNSDGELGNGDADGPDLCDILFDPDSEDEIVDPDSEDEVSEVDERPCSTVPVKVATGSQGFAPEQVAQVSAGGDHSCAVTTDSAVYCWGKNQFGQLGDGTTTESSVPVKVGRGSQRLAGEGVTDISSGYQLGCAVFDGDLFCWGENLDGQLGNGDANGPETCNSRACSRGPVLTGGVSVSPESVELGAVDVGGAQSRSVSVGSSFFGAVNVGVAVQDEAKGREFFSFADGDCRVGRGDDRGVSGLTLPGLSSCGGVLSFVPEERGSFGGVVSVTPEVAGAPDPDRTVEVAVNGKGVQAELQVPESVDVGEVPVGSSKSVTVTVSNPNNVVGDVDTAVPVTISEVKLDQEVGSGLSIADTLACVGELAPGDTCEVAVTFAPEFDALLLGDKRAVLTVVSDAVNGDLQVSVTATGTSAKIDVSPNSVMFEDTLSGREGSEQSVTVQNTGDAPLKIKTDEVGVTGGDEGLFTVDAEGCKSEVSPNGSCTMTVGFAGEDEGSFAATLVIPSNAQVPDGETTPPPAEVGLSATTPDAVLAVKGGDEFPVTGVGSAPTQTVTVVNASGSGTTISEVTVAGNEDFRLTDKDNCSKKRLKAGDECQVGIRFAPKTEGGRAATLQVTRQGQSNPESFGLSGEGAYPEASAVVKNFLKVPVGKQRRQTVVVKNTGDVGVRVKRVRGYTSEFQREKDSKQGGSLKGDLCRSRSLQPGGTCRVTVVFAPDQVGQRAATVTVVANTRIPRQQVPLRGVGVAPVVTGEPVDFGVREVGTVTTKTAVITNEGDAPLEVTRVSVTDEKGTESDEFAVADASDCTDDRVPRGGQCKIEVRFFPRDDTQSAAILTVKSNAVESPNSLAVSGTGFTVITRDETPAGPNEDHDGDGIPNKNDSDYRPKGDDDGDGVSNKKDPDFWIAADDELAVPGGVRKLSAPTKKRTKSKFTVTWKKPKDIGSAQPDGYQTRITKKGTSKKASRAKTWTKWKSQDWVPAPNGKLSQRFKKLSPNSTYTVQVRAHNVAGNGKKKAIKVTTNRKGIPKKYGTG